MLVAHARVQAARVEQARMSRDLELAVDQEIAARHHALPFADSTPDRVELTGPWPEGHLPRFEEALVLLDVDELPQAAVEHRRHGDGQWAAARLRCRHSHECH